MTELRVVESTVDTMAAAPMPGHILGAVTDDWHAAEIWLANVREKAKAKKKGLARKAEADPTEFVSETEVTYRFHLAKLRWYCENVSRITPSRWSAMEVQHFSEFLENLPPDAYCLRSDPSRESSPFVSEGELGWTPFRSQPSPSSQSDIKRCIHAMFNTWYKTGYIRLNPMALQGAGSIRKVDTGRSIPLEVYDIIVAHIAEQSTEGFADRQRQMRDLFIFEALRGLGLRASEMVNSQMSAFYQVTDPKTRSRFWVFRVEAESAKGGKPRKIPVTHAVWQAFLRYRAAFGLSPEPLPGDPAGLLLSPRTRAVIIASKAVKRTSDRRFFQAWREVTTRQGLYKIVKERLKATADELRVLGEFGAAERLEQASPHWLRHTFGKSKVEEGLGMRQLAGALGHASVATTMAYTEQEALDLIEAYESSNPGSVAKEAAA